MSKFSPNTDEVTFFKEIEYRYKINNILYIDKNQTDFTSLLFDVCKSKKFFFWYDFKKTVWWMKDNTLIDMQIVTKLKEYHEWVIQTNLHIKLESKSLKGYKVFAKNFLKKNS